MNEVPMLTYVRISYWRICKYIISFIVLSLFASQPFAASAEAPRLQSIEIDFPGRRLEERFEFRIIGLSPETNFELELRSQLAGVTPWRSKASVRSDSSGALNFTGSNAAGAEHLLWSMTEIQAPEEAPFELESSNAWWQRGSFRLTLAIRQGGDELATRTNERIFRSSGVSVRRLLDSFRPQFIYRPACAFPVPAVVLLQNGENALIHIFAALIASRGVVATIINYAPNRMIRSHPLEQVEDAILWTKNQPYVLPTPPLLFGVSRSAELALLMAANFQNIGPVVAYHPSSVAHAALGPTGVADEPAWLIGGQPIISLQRDNRFFTATREGLQRPPFRLEPRYSAMFGDPEAFLRSRIPVERINNPILLVSGSRDAIWPAAMMANQILAARAATGGSASTTSLVYHDAGHAIGVPNFPLGTLTFRSSPNSRPYDFGGDLLATSAASFAAWQEVSKFIDNWKHQVQQNSSQQTVEDTCRAE
jgi:dienelactone hydrolase